MSAPASLVQDLLDEVQTALGDLVPNLYLAADTVRAEVQQLADAAIAEADLIAREKLITGATAAIGATLGTTAGTALGASIGGPYGTVLGAPMGGQIGRALGTAIGDAFSTIVARFLEHQLPPQPPAAPVAAVVQPPAAAA